MADYEQKKIIYDQGWMDGRDSAENEFENFGRIPNCIGGSKWYAIKHQIRGIIHILRFKEPKTFPEENNNG